MSTVVARVDTSHTDAVNDAQLNYHGTRLATCSSDRSIRIFEVKPNGQSYSVAELAGHHGPVWRLSWAHPRYNSILASAGYDKRVLIWQETGGRWKQIHEYSGHEASVNCVAFAPPQHGLMFAAASADGSFSVHTFDTTTSTWATSKIPRAHEAGVNAVTWAPPVHLAAFDGSDTTGAKRLATCGNDRLVKIWVQPEAGGEWTLEKELAGHADFVRDVAWMPVVAHDTLTIASCGIDRALILWRSRGNGEGEWAGRQLERADGALWHVSWSLCGGTLAVSGEDNKIAYWKENLQREWVRYCDDEKQ